jgi:cysteine-rich repeat protein
MCNTMRTSILSAAILGLFAAGCAGDLSGTGPGTGDDVEPPVNCGNGQMDPGETCDDGNTASGDGCSASCTNENATTPKVNIAIDKPTVMTELNKNTMITVTLTGEGGFDETVNLTATVVDGTGTTIPGWTVMFNNASVAVPNNGSATAVATVHVPSDSAALSANVKIQVMSSLGTTDAIPTAFTVLNQITYEMTNGGNGKCVLPTGVNLANPVNVKVGTKVRFVNKFAPGITTNNLITIHVVGANDKGVPHEPDPGHAIDAAYEKEITAVGTNPIFQWWCHAPADDPGTANRPTFNVVP